jgi:hypothetical protein
MNAFVKSAPRSIVTDMLSKNSPVERMESVLIRHPHEVEPAERGAHHCTPARGREGESTIDLLCLARQVLKVSNILP